VERLCKFAVLRYVPDEIRKEFINIGLVFHAPSDGQIDIKITNNFSRVTAFDDEIDTKFLKIVLKGIKSEFSQSTVHGPSINEARNESFLEEATKMYVNQIQFSPIYTIRSLDLDKDFEDLFRTYVYFDANKDQRITDLKVKSIMNRVLKEKHSLYRLNRDLTIDIGPEEIELDYAYKSKEKAKIIKTFSFDYTPRGSKSAPQLAKEWAWNFSKIRNLNQIENLEVSGKDIQIVTFVYVGNVNQNIKTALKILEDESKNLFKADNQETIEYFANKINEELNE
jgi:hypothetical protein